MGLFNDRASMHFVYRSLVMRTYYRIVETDNLDGDYPDEKFVALPLLSEPDADAIAAMINMRLSGDHPGRFPRYWKVVADGYKLQPGLEP